MRTDEEKLVDALPLSGCVVICPNQQSRNTLKELAAFRRGGAPVVRHIAFICVESADCQRVLERMGGPFYLAPGYFMTVPIDVGARVRVLVRDANQAYFGSSRGSP